MAESDWAVPLHDPEYVGREDKWPGSVLLSDEIERYCALSPPLISPFHVDDLKPARYQLRLGREARIDGRLRPIDEQHPLVIEPHQVAIVQTNEEINLPRFLIARWNLRVDMVYKGLLWVGALQVDPGWRGYLPCPLYNMSSQAVQIQFNEKLFSIDFVRTTWFQEGKSKQYRPYFPKPNPALAVFDEHRLKSGPFDTLSRVDRVAKEVVRLRNHVTRFGGVTVTALGIVVAAIGVVAVNPQLIAAVGRPAVWPKLALGISIFSLMISLSTFGYVADRVTPLRQRGERKDEHAS